MHQEGAGFITSTRRKGIRAEPGEGRRLKEKPGNKTTVHAILSKSLCWNLARRSLRGNRPARYETLTGIGWWPGWHKAKDL
jgi:hypothetical protein